MVANLSKGNRQDIALAGQRLARAVFHDVRADVGIAQDQKGFWGAWAHDGLPTGYREYLEGDKVKCDVDDNKAYLIAWQSLFVCLLDKMIGRDPGYDVYVVQTEEECVG